MPRLKDSARPLEKRDEGKRSQMKVINIVVVPTRKNELFADKYDTKSTFEPFGDCASVRHRS
ncbi:hypothetical protein BS47DRAFT_1355338 [Hydnum rufescens UP504]|uniref:Uncharacterized protein n=1 Tax=Hydnum rufescens UP504 TaxID=1448309 RepID=A0A9P6AEB9_9AGAM|nr:hypothetical protein BS47DRAFT_1355338 [Hydnum rufescens UP504]